MLLIELQCLPPILFFIEWTQQRKLILEKYENYQKRSYRNRIYLADPQGKMFFSIPLRKGKNENQRINEVQISYDWNWPEQLSRQLHNAYQRAPFFEHYVEGLLTVLRKNHSFLFELNLDLLHWIRQILCLHLEYEFTTEYKQAYPPVVLDLRNKILPTGPNHQGEYRIRYEQVFEEKNTFIKNLSILDMLFCCGPETLLLIKNSSQC